jgi:hypothetical protein
MLKWFRGAVGTTGITGNRGAKLEHPLQDANEARRVADALSNKEPVKALEEASQWLLSIQQTVRLRRQSRFELIDLIDTATRKAQARVADDYVMLLESDRREENLIWQKASGFWGLLGDGYLACVGLSGDSAEFPQEIQSLLPLLAARGIRALRQQMKWASMRYSALRAEIWAEFGRYLNLAESVDGAATPIDLYVGANMRVSPCDEFARAMMFWSALPGALSPVEQDIAERLVVHLTSKFRFSNQLLDGSDYFFDVDGARPPLRFVAAAPVSSATRYFDIGEARQALQAMRSLVNSTGYLPAGVDCGPAGEINVTVRVLKHLAVHWAKELPPRAAGRRKAGLPLRAAHGYPQVLAVVQHGGLNASELLKIQRTELWVAEDVSAGGCGVIVPEDKRERLQVGVLLALQPQNEASCSVGLIRRVSDYGKGQHHIGIQLISTSAVPVYLRSVAGAKQGRNRENAILLNAQPSANGSLYILARRDLFSGREPVEAAFGVPEATVILEPGGVVESGKDFDWLRYQMTAPAA